MIRRPLRLVLGRRRPIHVLPYTGPASCGCRFLNGDHIVPCTAHAELVIPTANTVPQTGQHTTDEGTDRG